MNQLVVPLCLAATAIAWSWTGFGLTTTTILLMALWLAWHAYKLEQTTRALRESESRNEQIRQQLTTAKEAADAGDRSKSTFLATISHEIRTPLNGVVGMASLLLDTDLTAEQRKSVEGIQECSDALLELINDILDFSKLEAGRFDVESRPFNLIDLCQAVFSIIEPRARSKNVTLVFSPSAELPAMIESDSRRLRQVLLNLVGNALKFTESGAVILHARPAGGGDAPRIRFEVIDTGIGISADAQLRLFTEFSQVDASITRRYGGTGLGLAICKKIVTAMGGEIGVHSEVGKGSTFWFELPFAAADLTPAPMVVPQHSAASLAILLADDNAVNRRIATTMLTNMGHTVDMAVNGRDAVAKAALRVYDVVIMDMQMPEMDGLEAARALRALRGPEGHVPVIAMTANAFAADRDACLAAGMNDFLLKPITARKLFDAIKPWASGAREDEAGPDGAKAAKPNEAAHEAAPPVDTDLIEAEHMRTIEAELGSTALKELLISFWADAGGLLQALQLALSMEDPTRAADVLHTLKETAASLGLTGCSNACEDGRAAIAEGRTPDLGPLLVMLAKTLQATEPRIVGTARPAQAA